MVPGPINKTQKELLESLGFEQEEVTSDPGPQNEEISIPADQVFTAAKTDLNFLAGIALPTVFKYLFPAIYLAIWNWLLSFTTVARSFSQLAIGLPRAFAKTTFIKIYCLYCILFTEKKFILIVSSTATLAENIIADIIGMLDESNIRAVFGNWRVGAEIDRQDLKKFGYRGRTVIIAGIGVGGSIRGLNIQNERPDVMIFEDIQTREAAESQVQSLAIEKWMYSTAMKAKSPSGCMFIFIANMYPTKWSILRKLKNNPTWLKFIVGGILSDGTSLWEELQPIEQLLQEFENDLAAGHPEIFYSEVLNDENAAVNNLIDLARIPAYPFKDDDISAGNYIIIDPATDKPGADAVSIGYFEIHDATPCLIEVEEGSYSPGETIRRALIIAMRRNCRVIAVESNAYQSTLCYWFQFICQQMQIEGIEAVEVYSGGYSKNSRIIQMFKELTSGELKYHPATAALVNSQITQFNALKRDNTDGILDLLAYARKVLELYGAAISSYTVIQSQEWANVKVPDFNTCF